MIHPSLAIKHLATHFSSKKQNPFYYYLVQFQFSIHLSHLFYPLLLLLWEGSPPLYIKEKGKKRKKQSEKRLREKRLDRFFSSVRAAGHYSKWWKIKEIIWTEPVQIEHICLQFHFPPHHGVAITHVFQFWRRPIWALKFLLLLLFLGFATRLLLLLPSQPGLCPRTVSRWSGGWRRPLQIAYKTALSESPILSIIHIAYTSAPFTQSTLHTIHIAYRCITINIAYRPKKSHFQDGDRWFFYLEH